MMRRRGFMLLLGAATTGLWLPQTGLIALSRAMVLDLSASGRCSFCGKLATEVAGLAGARGRTVRICNECIGLCLDILGEELGADAPPVPGPEAEGELVSEAKRLEDAFERLGVSRDELAAEAKQLDEAFERVGVSREELVSASGAQQGAAPPAKRDDPASLACSFCDAYHEDVHKLIAGPTVYVCDGCIGDASAVFSAHLRA